MQPDRKPRPSMDGIHRPINQVTPIPPPDYRPDHELAAPEIEQLLPEHTYEEVSSLGLPGRRSWLKWVTLVVLSVVVAAAIVFSLSYGWYQQQLRPESNDTTLHVRVNIVSGATPDMIAKKLKTAGVIRNSLAFTIYAKLSHSENNLKAGVYDFQPSLSTPAIVDQLVSGKIGTFNVTFLPGDILANTRKALLSLGYSTQAVDAALNKDYSGPLFDGKPAGADLEGYMYGETNEFDSSATVEMILQKFFDEYESFITQNGIESGFAKQGLTLYQGITLASIVQREASNAQDEKQIARVFLNRLAAGMTLGSDVTYQYAAKKLGIAPSPTLDSPYNTRIHTGLPPGPIATPGDNALLAVASPADNNYLFFLSGDDGKMYYAVTDAQHQQNVADHCQKNCAAS